MVEPMRRGGRIVEESHVDSTGGWALGRLHLASLQPKPQIREGQSLQVLFHGDLHNEAELRATLADGVPIAGDTTADLVTALYHEHGRDFASKLRGAFCAVVLDADAGELLLINDAVGSYPLYWFAASDRFVFASELKSVLRAPGVETRLNPRAVADYFSYGFVFGEKTLAEGVDMLPSGATLKFSRETGDVDVSRYSHPQDLFDEPRDDESEYLEDLAKTFKSSIGSCLEGDLDVGVSLSGGLDSRAILSAIDCRERSIATYTLGVEGCADQVIADKISKLLGTKHRFFELDDSYLGEFLPNLREMVSLTDGMYLTHGLTEMLALKFIDEMGFQVLLRGHGGELAKTSLAWPLHTDTQIEGMSSKDEFVSYMFDRVNYISSGGALEGVLTDGWAASVEGGGRKSMEESLSSVTLNPADLCSYLYLEEHHRRFTMASLELFRNSVEVRMPFVDTEFLRTLFRGRAMWRADTRIHQAITRASNPALLKIRNSNTGAPAGAGKLVEFVADKFNSLFKRLNLYGYRHYHSFNAWMQKTLLESVEEILLDPSALARGIYREDGLRRLISETRSGLADHAYLFQILLLIELWQQDNIREGVPA